MISKNDISIILQGSIIKTETLKCLKSIRKFLPDSEVILSTWQGAEVEENVGWGFYPNKNFYSKISK